MDAPINLIPAEAAVSGGPPASIENRLAAHLMELGKLDERGLQRARRAAASAEGRLADILAQLGIVSERDLAEAIAAISGLPLVPREQFPQEAVLMDRLSARFLREAVILPLAADEAEIVVAMANPDDRFAIEAIRLAAQRRVNVCVGIPSELQAAIARLQVEKSGAANAGADGAEADASAEVDIDRLRDLASEAPVVRLVDQLISGAVAEHASDIHIEPFEDHLRVRYRIDGRLQEVESLPYIDRLAVTSRIKIMAGLNIAERRQPQDGRIRTAVDGGTLDIRVATAPTLHGESLVLRLLHRDRTALELPKLGFGGSGLQRLQLALDRPHGMVLVTGPTGSGKTTTLYAALSQLNRIDCKILTVEDPIEYQLPGVNQVQVNPKFGLTFAHVLRSFLRHDPDIIMVGEIRDAETAEIAVHAALTGHLVLATLHTNDAPSAVTRLIEMGVEDFLLTSTVVAVVGQRLVRTLCPHCRAKAEQEAVDIGHLGISTLKSTRIPTPYRPVGCERCRGTGFSGRTTISEVMGMSDGLRQLILAHGESRAIRDLAVREGMLTMLGHGVEKIGGGLTTLDEVLRATTDA
jgi:general secretion pathway protein E